MNPVTHWSENLKWIDPVSKKRMNMVVTSRHPSGRPLTGALQIEGTSTGYPIINGIHRLTPELAMHYSGWLEMIELNPPERCNDRQSVSTVDSFGFEWTWDNEPRTEDDLLWRVASRYEIAPSDFRDQFVLDAGCGAGDQSRWILNRGGAAKVVSIDLSQAIEVAYQKLQNNPNWLGIQGDLTALPFENQLFSFVYCEGVIQHTQNSESTVNELLRVLGKKGYIAATHYGLPSSRKEQIRFKLRNILRLYLSKLDKTTLLFVSGLLAVPAYIPVFGYFWGRTVAVINPRMPSFKSTWCCTYDNYGSHAYQRHISPSQFASYFQNNQNGTIVRQNGTEILAKKL